MAVDDFESAAYSIARRLRRLRSQGPERTAWASVVAEFAARGMYDARPLEVLEQEIAMHLRTLRVVALRAAWTASDPRTGKAADVDSTPTSELRRLLAPELPARVTELAVAGAADHDPSSRRNTPRQRTIPGRLAADRRRGGSCVMNSATLHPNQFRVNDAWIAFQINQQPIETVRDGSFNCICIMNAASCFILANTMIPAHQQEPSELDARRLLETAWERSKQNPEILFVPGGQFQAGLSAEAKRKGISVVSMREDQLLVFIGEAREGFQEHQQRRNRER